MSWRAVLTVQLSTGPSRQLKHWAIQQLIQQQQQQEGAALAAALTELSRDSVSGALQTMIVNATPCWHGVGGHTH